MTAPIVFTRNAEEHTLNLDHVVFIDHDSNSVRMSCGHNLVLTENSIEVVARALEKKALREQGSDTDGK